MSGIEVMVCTSTNAGAAGAYLADHRSSLETKQVPHRELSLISWDRGRQKKVGYLSIDGECAACDSKVDAADLASIDVRSLGYNSSTSAYVHCVQVDIDSQVAVTLQLLQSVFSDIPTLTHLLLIHHTELQHTTHPGLVAHFSQVLHSSDSKLWLYECSRQTVLPTLQVRKARVEDHDDLIPIVAGAAEGSCASLAALPASCRPDEPYALTRLIGNQDSQNVVLVALDERKLVGLLVATTQLDISLLHQSFDLGPYDGFLPAEMYENCEATALANATTKVQLQHQQLQVQQEQQVDAETAEEAVPAEPPTPTADDIREELLPLLQDALQQLQRGQDNGNAGHSLVAITMLCVLPGYEARATDFLQSLFAELPGKEYCCLSLPQSSPEPRIARFMSFLNPLPTSMYPEVLLLMHRAALQQVAGDFVVRLAEPDDVIGLHGLLGGLENAVEVQEAFLHALGRHGALVATVQGEVIGMVATTPAVDLALLQSNFRLQETLGDDCCVNPQDHAELDACVMNPIFVKSAGALLAGALQLIGKKYLHYALMPGHPVPDWHSVMQQQPARHNIPAGATQAELTLFSFTKHMAFAAKQVINSRVVIAGASETALSCLEQLLVQPHMSFTSITLLAPGGVSVGGVASSYTASVVARMGLEASAVIVDGHMVAIDPAQKLLQLADGSQLPYDLLLVATGLQDQLGPAIAGACPEASHFILSSQQLINGNITPEAASGLNSVLLYGADLQAYDVVSALTDAGMSAGAITWLCPDQQQEDPLLPLLLTLAAQIELELPKPQQGQLLELMPTEDDSRAVAALQAARDPGPAQQLELDLLVGCGRRGPSAAVARCLGAAGLVWDGRLVVDAGYRSSDPAIMGAGPAVKFSRRYTLPEVMHEHYSSTELGASLAAAIADVLAEQSPLTLAAAQVPSPSSLSSMLPVHDGQLPPLRRGKVLGCRLPGGYVFAFAGCPAAVADPSLTPPVGGRSLISKQKITAVAAASVNTAEASTEQPKGGTGLVNICLDGADFIHHVAYIGPQAPAAAKLAGLVGLPFSYLAAALQLPAKQVNLRTAAAGGASNNGDGNGSTDGAGSMGLLYRPNISMRGIPGVTAGPEPGVYILEQDILAELAKPWAALLFHDSMASLRQQVVQGCNSMMQSEELIEAQPGNESFFKQLVEDRARVLTAEVMQRCSNELQGYKIGPSSLVSGKVC